MSPMAVSLFLGILACLITLLAGWGVVPCLGRYSIRKAVRSDGPPTHLGKNGTPTMGGILISGVVLVATTLAVIVAYPDSGRSILLPLSVLAGCSVLGGFDDLLSLQASRHRGLSAPAKLGGLLSIGLPAAMALWHPQFLGLNTVFLPTVREPFHAPAWLYVPLAVIAIVGTANAVNLTDGLDSLAGWSSFVAFSAFGIIAYLYGQHYLVTFCFTVAGAVAAFLWFNAYPAQVFMGDTGSLALGATLAVVALMLGQVLLLPIIGAVFVAEALSVILQVSYFKLSGGGRLFRMAPLHHHFELLGWSETHVAQRFWLAGVLAAMLGVALALL
jgi:phospho-N-acetylmuramoyl-pentapeptide-transferase